MALGQAQDHLALVLVVWDLAASAQEEREQGLEVLGLQELEDMDQVVGSQGFQGPGQEVLLEAPVVLLDLATAG